MYSNCYRFNNLYIGLIQPKKIAYVRMQSFFLYSYLEKHEKERDGKEMIKFGKGVVKHRVLILIISFALLIPAAFGYFNTRVNYDILSYLPDELESMKGQDILVDEFGTGAFSLCVINFIRQYVHWYG